MIMWASGTKASEATVYRGVITSADIRLGDLTADGSDRDLDLSALVPVGTKFVLVSITLISTTVGNSFLLKEVGHSEYDGDWRFICHVVSQSHMARVWFALDGDRKLIYSASGGTWVSVDISVLQWKI